jgi:hypothetical protein
MLREVARVLADNLKKRVVIVDTSNEIAGDGDIPHPAIGHARRMQVTTPAKQHDVMIEAVENHMPEVIVIDEIGTELEAQAARTIAERGVQLVGTAHGITLENLMVNPTLSDLIGGIQAVTLGDEEARRRGTQKTILERKAPPTFDIVVEIQDRNRVAIHPDVVAAVDAALRGQTATVETRWLDENGEVVTQLAAARATASAPARPPVRRRDMPRLFLFGINRHRFEQQSRELKITPNITDKMADADLLLTSKNYYHRRPQKIRDAEAANLPVYVLKNHTPAQFRQFLNTIHPMDEAASPPPDSLREALREAERAVSQIGNGQEVVQLSPQSAYIRRLQHLIAQRSDLASISQGQEPGRRVTIRKGEARV